MQLHTIQLSFSYKQIRYLVELFARSISINYNKNEINTLIFLVRRSSTLSATLL